MDEEKQTAQFDEVRCPAHYAGDGEVECKRAMRSMAAGYDKSTASTACRYWAIAAFKYLWRFPLKGKPLEDLRKARECIDLAIEAYEADKERPSCWIHFDAVKTDGIEADVWTTLQDSTVSWREMPFLTRDGGLMGTLRMDEEEEGGLDE